MSSDVKDFMDQTKSDIIALGDFARVLIIPAVDIQLLMQNPRWPTALMNDGGGILDEHNHKLWRRILNVTVVDAHPRDTWGEESTRQLFDLGEALVAGLEYNVNDALFLEADSDIVVETAPLGLLIVHKTYSFAYEIERS